MIQCFYRHVKYNFERRIILNSSEAEFFGRENVWKILLKIAPPVMAAQLIQALYNIVDSFFVGKISSDALTALSVIYPVQQLITAIAIGTGVGVNALMARQYSQHNDKAAENTAATGTVIAAAMWFVFTILSLIFMRPFCNASAGTESAAECAVQYGLIVSTGSIGIFLESIWTKIHQASGNMKLPMAAQIAGAVTNIILDPIMIFKLDMGIKGAAFATVIGQLTAAAIVGAKCIRRPPCISEMLICTKQIFSLGYPSICMQALYTFYISALNMILAGFGNEAVTVLGLYYKLQAFFFIPFLGLQSCVVPVISYNFGIKDISRCRKVFSSSVIVSVVMMLVGMAAFEFFPDKLIMIFSHDEKVISIGITAFRIIAFSFIPIVFSLMPPTFLMSVGYSRQSAFLSILRQIICFVPIFKLLSLAGLEYCWWAYLITELITGTTAMIMYYKTVQKIKYS